MVGTKEVQEVPAAVEAQVSDQCHTYLRISPYVYLGLSLIYGQPHVPKYSRIRYMYLQPLCEMLCDFIKDLVNLYVYCIFTASSML